jgi:hypothetical protein
MHQHVRPEAINHPLARLHVKEQCEVTVADRAVE